MKDDRRGYVALRSILRGGRVDGLLGMRGEENAFLLRKLRETARQHLAHHAEIVAGDGVGRDVEGAVLVLHEAFRPGDDHAADGVRAHDVGVVVDLDPAWGGLHAEGGAERGEQRLLPGILGELARERFAGVLDGMGHQVGAFAALGMGDLDLAPGAGRKRLADQFDLLDRVREQYEARRRLVVVELGDDGGEHFGRRQRTVGPWEEGAVAPVLVVAEEEDLDAEMPGLLVDGEDVGFLNALRIDVLPRLHGRERGEPVAVARRLLEFELLRRFLHPGGQQLLHRRGAAGEEVASLAGERLVFGDRDLARAGAGAALDLEEQAGARAVLVERIRAGADQEGLLQRVDGARHCPDRGEGAEIIALAMA